MTSRIDIESTRGTAKNLRALPAAQGDSQGVQLVDGLVLVGPLQVHLDLPDQRKAVRVRNVQLLHLADAVFLSRHTGMDVKWGKSLQSLKG